MKTITTVSPIDEKGSESYLILIPATKEEIEQYAREGKFSEISYEFGKQRRINCGFVWDDTPWGRLIVYADSWGSPCSCFEWQEYDPASKSEIVHALNNDDWGWLLDRLAVKPDSNIEGYPFYSVVFKSPYGPVLVDYDPEFGDILRYEFTETTFVNFSNHPSTGWSDDQKTAAIGFDASKIVDVPFPNVPPTATTEQIHALAEEYVNRILDHNPSAVMVMGEFSLTYEVTKSLKENGVTVVVSTSERQTVENPDGTKTSRFNFVQFREV